MRSDFASWNPMELWLQAVRSLQQVPDRSDGLGAERSDRRTIGRLRQAKSARRWKTSEWSLAARSVPSRPRAVLIDRSVAMPI